MAYRDSNIIGAPKYNAGIFSNTPIAIKIIIATGITLFLNSLDPVISLNFM